MGVPIELEKLRKGTELVKRGFASMQKGGVIMDVVKPEQARIAEDAGAVAVMALEAVPSDIRKQGGVARMADPAIIKSIIKEVSIPVMGKARIGHTTEAQILESIGVDMIDESEGPVILAYKLALLTEVGVSPSNICTDKAIGWFCGNVPFASIFMEYLFFELSHVETCPSNPLS